MNHLQRNHIILDVDVQFHKKWSLTPEPVQAPVASVLLYHYVNIEEQGCAPFVAVPGCRTICDDGCHDVEVNIDEKKKEYSSEEGKPAFDGSGKRQKEQMLQKCSEKVAERFKSHRKVKRKKTKSFAKQRFQKICFPKHLHKLKAKVKS